LLFGVERIVRDSKSIPPATRAIDPVISPDLPREPH